MNTNSYSLLVPSFLGKKKEKDQKSSFTAFLISVCESVSVPVCEKVSEWVVGDEWVRCMWEHLAVKKAQKES